MKSYLNASEVAKLLNINRATVTRWAQHGKLKGAVRVGKSHQWRIPLSTYEELVKHKGEHSLIFSTQEPALHVKRERGNRSPPFLTWGGPADALRSDPFVGGVS